MFDTLVAWDGDEWFTLDFWSNALNAFIFGHGPMTITLADVYMLTGLRITRSL